jgi:hypothetical protein
VALAVTDAIAHYSVKRLSLNEGFLNEAAVTTANVPYYPIPENFAGLILAEVTSGGAYDEEDPPVYQGGQRTELLAGMSWETYRRLTATTVTGVPTDIVFYATNFFLYPCPDGEYPVSMSYRSKAADLTESGEDTDSNAWTTTGEKLIRARAKWDLLANVIRQYDEAQVAKTIELAEYAHLQERTVGQGRSRRVEPMRW